MSNGTLPPEGKRTRTRVPRSSAVRVEALKYQQGYRLTSSDPEVLYAVERYTPRWNERDLGIWDQTVGPVVREWCIRCMDAKIQSGYDALRYMANFALYAHKNYGSLEPNRVFRPDIVNHFIFVENRLKTPDWRKQAAAMLRRIGPFLAPKAPWPNKGPKLKRQMVKLPYSADEESSYARMARAVVGVKRKRVLAAVAVGFGAGLDGRWIPALEVSNIEHLAHGRLAIQVPDPSPRFVPVRAEYSGMLAEAVELTMQGRFLDRGSRQRGPSVRWKDMSEVWRVLVVGGLGQIDPARMRNTWVCAHIRNGTPLPYLARLCGFANTRAISELIPYAGVEDEQAAYEKALEA